MTIYNALMIVGVIVVVAIIVKGFWSARRVKAIEQPDNWQTGGNQPTDPHQGGD
jgi:FtsZ-interacting cell division protein ZipA